MDVIGRLRLEQAVESTESRRFKRRAEQLPSEESKKVGVAEFLDPSQKHSG